MNILTDLVARLLYALPMAIFGLFHFMNGPDMAAMAPFGGVVMVYITGAALIAAGVSIIIKKMASLATLLLGIMLLIFVVTIHIPGGEASMPMILKDTALAGAAFFMSGIFKKEEG